MILTNGLAKFVRLIIVLTLIISVELFAADLLVINADVRTSDPLMLSADAIAVKDGKFFAVGTSSEILTLKSKDTEIIDAQGKTVLPGFVDSHTHLNSGSNMVTGINLAGIAEKSIWLDMIAERVKSMKPGEWLLGGRWDYTLENKGLPNRWELDQVSPNNPVALMDIDGHSIWINSLAIQEANIKANSKVSRGGKILIEESSGEPNGILLESARELLWDAPSYVRDSEISIEKIERVLSYANSYGITSIHDMSTLSDLDKYKELAINKKLSVRIFWGEFSKYSQDEDSTNNEELLNQRIDTYKFYDTVRGPLIKFGFIKYMVDGVLSTYTAALVDPYSDRPDFTGDVFYKQAEINKLVKRANDFGMPVAIHAIGDRGVQMALNAFERSGNTALANRIEHVEIIKPEDIPRFRKLNVTASMQPNHGTGVIGKYITPRVGVEREKYAYVWNEFLKEGARLVLSSDFATSPFSPLIQLADAVFRESPDGSYEGSWYPEQALTFEQALHAYTQIGADLAGWGDQIGSISRGKYADFVILDRILSKPVGRELKSAKVEKTYFAGQLVFSKN